MGICHLFWRFIQFYQHDPRSPIKPAPNAKLILTLVGTINTGTIAGLAPFFSFWIAKKPGIRRRLMFSGLLTCALSIFLSSYSTSAFHILLSQGIGYGVGGCALYYAALSHLPEWFDQRQGFANGLVFTGTGLGGVVFPLILNSLLGRFGAKLALQIVTALFSIPIFLAVFFICPRVSNVHQRQDSSVHSVSSLEDKTLPSLYLPTYIHCLGLGSVTGSALLSILNAGTIFAQLAGGVLSDHYSPFLIGVTSNVLGGTCVLIFWADRELLFSAYGVLSMTRGIGNILGGPISSALVSSPLTDPQQCGGFPKGSFSGPASALVQDGGEIETKTKEASDSFLNF
ncbi:hypothetical protein KEM48_008102 [Puccinia striiformis f. sp. tritici PST-130]|nr:hypothetical protein KEM48_008102 [Puccinia striiformis f. sp. tritici PST-130]